MLTLSVQIVPVLSYTDGLGAVSSFVIFTVCLHYLLSIRIVLF